MMNLTRSSLKVSAVAAILAGLPAAASAQQLSGSTWSCAASSNMRNDANYRLYYRTGFDAMFKVVVSPVSSGKVVVGIVSEQWTYGAKAVVEYKPRVSLERDPKGREVIRMTYLGVTRSTGDTRRYPTFVEGLLNFDDSGRPYLSLLVNGSGDVVAGRCYPG